MGLAKHQYHDEINAGSVEGPCFAEEEYYAEMKRHEQNRAKKANNAATRQVPTAPAVTVYPKSEFNFSIDHAANPDTDAERFEQAKRDADEWAARTGDEIIVFKNPGGFYLMSEKKTCVFSEGKTFCISLNDILYTAGAK